MSWKTAIARMLAPGMMDEGQVRALVEKEMAAARMAAPVNFNWDPKGEGYRKLTAEQEQNRRDLTPVHQDTMFELAYYMYDTSGIVKRFVRDTKNFCLGEGITVDIGNDPSGAARDIFERFWNDPMNQLDLRLEKRVEFLGLLGEQCWPVVVNPRDGRVWLSYVDPVNIDEVMTVPDFPEIPAAVRIKGSSGRSGRTLSVIRPELDVRRANYGRMVGECFFLSVNNPPNGPRGRSDLIHLFDFINGFEEGIFDELDRLKLIKSFIWDVLLEGADDQAIHEFLLQNPTPKAGSVRAHNERVKWEAVAPDLKMADNKAFFDMMKAYLSGCMARPDSWFGSGGKAYQVEADLMGEPTFKDLASRQRYMKFTLEHVIRFVLDQAVVHGVLREDPNAPFLVTVNMPEMSAKDTGKTAEGIGKITTALVAAETHGWITKETAARLFASVAGKVGVEIDVEAEMEATAGGIVTPDYMPGAGNIPDDKP